MSPVEPCDLCGGTGEMRWQQPDREGVLHEASHPCPRGCSGWWRAPAAERDDSAVIGAEDEGPGDDFIREFLRKAGVDHPALGD